jgi:hypothetical protein
MGAFAWRYADKEDGAAAESSFAALTKKWPSLKGHFLLTSRPNGGDA